MVTVDEADQGFDQEGRSRRPGAGSAALFALVATLYYAPGRRLAQLVSDLHLSASTIKRLLHELRDKNVARGRLDSLRLNLASLPQAREAFFKAVIFVETDVTHLKTLSNKRGARPYSSEEGLLAWLCGELPRCEPYRNTVLVQAGDIVMGPPRSSLQLIVHGSSSQAVADFARLGVERAEGVTRTETYFIVHSWR